MTDRKSATGHTSPQSSATASPTAAPIGNTDLDFKSVAPASMAVTTAADSDQVALSDRDTVAHTMKTLPKVTEIANALLKFRSFDSEKWNKIEKDMQTLVKDTGVYRAALQGLMQSINGLRVDHMETISLAMRGRVTSMSKLLQMAVTGHERRLKTVKIQLEDFKKAALTVHDIESKSWADFCASMPFAGSEVTNQVMAQTKLAHEQLDKMRDKYNPEMASLVVDETKAFDVKVSADSDHLRESHTKAQIEKQLRAQEKICEAARRVYEANKKQEHEIVDQQGMLNSLKNSLYQDPKKAEEARIRAERVRDQEDYKLRTLQNNLKDQDAKFVTAHSQTQKATEAWNRSKKLRDARQKDYRTECKTVRDMNDAEIQKLRDTERNTNLRGRSLLALISLVEDLKKTKIMGHNNNPTMVRVFVDYVREMDDITEELKSLQTDHKGGADILADCEKILNRFVTGSHCEPFVPAMLMCQSKPTKLLLEDSEADQFFQRLPALLSPIKIEELPASTATATAAATAAAPAKK